jgi:hypothetical protein
MAQLGFLGHEASTADLPLGPVETTGRAACCPGCSWDQLRLVDEQAHPAPRQPQLLGKDPDIVSGAVAFSAEAVETRGTVGSGWPGTGVLLPAAAGPGRAQPARLLVRHLLDRRPVRHRWVDLLFVGVRLVGYPSPSSCCLPPGIAIAFIGVQVGCFGFLLGGAFTPNHVGMRSWTAGQGRLPAPPGADVAQHRRGPLVHF